MASDVSEFNYTPRPVEMSEAVEFVLQEPAYHPCFRKTDPILKAITRFSLILSQVCRYLRQFTRQFAIHDDVVELLQQSRTVLQFIIARVSLVALCKMWVRKTETRHHFGDVLS